MQAGELDGHGSEINLENKMSRADPAEDDLGLITHYTASAALCANVINMVSIVGTDNNNTSIESLAHGLERVDRKVDAEIDCLTHSSGDLHLQSAPRRFNKWKTKRNFGCQRENSPLTTSLSAPNVFGNF